MPYQSISISKEGKTLLGHSAPTPSTPPLYNPPPMYPQGSQPPLAQPAPVYASMSQPQAPAPRSYRGLVIMLVVAIVVATAGIIVVLTVW